MLRRVLIASAALAMGPTVLSGATYDPATCGYSRHAALTGARKR